MNALLKPRSVVGEEDHEGAVDPAGFVEVVEQAPDVPVDFLHGVSVESAAAPAEEGVGGEERHMGHGGVEEEEVGLFARALDEVESAVKVATGQGGLVGWVFDDFGPLHQRGVLLDAALDEGSSVCRDGFDEGLVGQGAFPVVSESEYGVGGNGVVGIDPHIIAVGDAEVGIEAMGGGQGIGLISEVPLADGRGGVVRRLEDFGEGHFFVGEAFGIGKIDAGGAVAMRIAAGQQRRP